MAERVIHIPEVVEPDEALPPDLLALRRFAMIMDEAVAIPGTNRRVGLDAAVGLIPGVGDIAGAVLSAWIVVGALRHRVPLVYIARMLFYIALDAIVGAIPLAGDAFDFLFEENVINLKLLLRHRDRRRPPRTFREIGLAAILVIAFILALVVLAVFGTVAGAFWLIQHRNG